jgi:rod shape-determining protein MreC
MPPSFVPAEVVWVPGRGADGYFQLTAGASQQVRVGAPIVAPDGLVGRVVSVDPGIAFGIGWMNSQFRASAMTLDGTVYGLVEPREGPGGEPMLALTGTPRHVTLQDGALIVTSGHGGVFPRGIPIGRVSGVEGKETSWQRNYLIEPAVAPSEMTYVLVLGGPQPTEDENGADLAAAWGIRPGSSAAADTAAAQELAASASAGVPATTLPGPQTSVSQSAATTTTAPRPTRPAPRGPRLLGEPIGTPADTSGLR